MRYARQETHPQFNILPFTKIDRDQLQDLAEPISRRFWFVQLNGLTAREKESLSHYFSKYQPDSIIIEQCDAQACKLIVQGQLQNDKLERFILSQLVPQAAASAITLFENNPLKNLHLYKMDEAALTALSTLEQTNINSVVIYRFDAIAAMAVQERLKDTQTEIIMCYETIDAVKQFEHEAIAEHKKRVQGQSYKRVTQRIIESDTPQKKSYTTSLDRGLCDLPTNPLELQTAEQQRELQLLQAQIDRQNNLLQQQNRLMAKMSRTIEDHNTRITEQAKHISSAPK